MILAMPLAWMDRSLPWVPVPPLKTSTLEAVISKTLPSQTFRGPASPPLSPEGLPG